MSMSFDNFTEAALKTLTAASNLAKENANTSIQPAHIASVLLSDPEKSSNGQSLFADILSKAGAESAAVERGIMKIIVRLPAQDPPPDDISLSSTAAKVLREATAYQKASGDTYISDLHLIHGLLSDTQVLNVIKEAGSSDNAVKSALKLVRGGKKVDSKLAEDAFEALKKYAVDLTALAAEGKLDPVIGRDAEIRRVIRVLSRRTKNNPVLIGEPGVGKTAIAEGLAQRIVKRDVPVGLLGKLYSLDMGALMAGASYKGQFEERVKSVINEVEGKDNVILFIDELHLIMAGQSAGNGGMDAANLFKPALARGKIRCIGATTLAEYRKYIEKDAAFERRFQQVMVNEPSVVDTISILRGVREKYEVHHGVTILDSAIVAAAQLAHRYLTSRRLPDSAVDLIDEAAAGVRVARDSQPEIIEALDRKVIQLDVEIHALEMEDKRSNSKDPAAKERLEVARTEMKKLKEQLEPLRAQYEAQKSRADEIQKIKQRIDELKAKADDAERRYDVATAADIRYYALTDLNHRLEALEKAKAAEDKARGGILGEDAVTPDAVADIVARWTGIPVTRLKTSEKQKLLQMEKNLSKEVIGQPEAVKAVANAIRLSRSGLSNANRPVLSALFCGPSGTGKTQLVKALAKFLFDSEDCICRIDASEYSEKHTVSRLIGAAPGYIGYEEGGVLTEWVRRKPYSIVLVDEIEKASREFTTLFLQVLDDGRLTDSQGRVVSFKNCVVIMTSNLGAQFLTSLPEGQAIPKQTKEMVHAAIRAHFLPEFINRIDEIVIFNPLGRAQIKAIVDIRLGEIQRRLVDNGRNIKLDLDENAKNYLADIGYSTAYGARPLNRAIQSDLLNPLSTMIINESIKDGETAHVSFDGHANRLFIKANHPAVAVDGDMDIDYEDDLKVAEID